MRKALAQRLDKITREVVGEHMPKRRTDALAPIPVEPSAVALERAPETALLAAHAAHSRIEEIETARIDVGAQQLRGDLDEDGIIELALDIQRNGLLQAVGVLRLRSGRYQLLFGSRRLEAHRRLSKGTIQARVFEDDGQPITGVALRENILRTQLSLAEECRAVAHLHTVENKSPDQISDLVGKSRAWVLRRLSIPHLPPDLHAAVYDGAISISAAETIARVDDSGARAYLLQHAVSSKCSSAALGAMVETFEACPSISAAVAAGEAEAQQASTLGEPLFACRCCAAPVAITKLIVIRVCAPCDQVIAGAVRSAIVEGAMRDA